MDNKKSKKKKECGICESDAAWLCFECNNYFCESCYKMIHDKIKSLNHKKENIDPFIPIDLKCPYHPKDRMSLFCIKEQGKFIILLINKNFRNVLCILSFWKSLQRS